MIWDKAAILLILSNPLGKTGDVTNARIIDKMLKALYRRQTDDEQLFNTTKHQNGRGFTGWDAKDLSAIAQHGIMPANLHMVAARLKKYAGQLALIAAELKNEFGRLEQEQEMAAYARM